MLHKTPPSNEFLNLLSELRQLLKIHKALGQYRKLLLLLDMRGCFFCWLFDLWLEYASLWTFFRLLKYLNLQVSLLSERWWIFQEITALIEGIHLRISEEMMFSVFKHWIGKSFVDYWSIRTAKIPNHRHLKV